jgi:hypothetical protein
MAVAGVRSDFQHVNAGTGEKVSVIYVEPAHQVLRDFFTLFRAKLFVPICALRWHHHPQNDVDQNSREGRTHD